MSAAALGALLLASSTAHAMPKSKAARAEFDRGIALYKKKDYEGARAALSASAGLERDVETLFAWAQTERQLNNCKIAIELYEQLLEMDMPPANKKAIRPKIDECKQVLASQEPPPPPPEPEPEPTPEPTPPPVAEPPRAEPPPSTVAPTTELPPPQREGGSGLKHPVGLGLIGVGVLGLAVGGYFLYDGRQADLDSQNATNYFEYARLREVADTQGTRGVIAVGAGGAFAIAGIIWFATRGSDRDTRVSGWLSPSGGGGLVASGRF